MIFCISGSKCWDHDITILLQDSNPGCSCCEKTELTTRLALLECKGKKIWSRKMNIMSSSSCSSRIILQIMNIVAKKVHFFPLNSYVEASI